MNVEGRVVVVTGAGSGIGAALAEEAAARGASAVAIVDIDEAAAAAVAARITAGGGCAKAYGLDIADSVASRAVAESVTRDLGVPGLVCANAGISPDGAPLLDTDVRDLSWALAVNVVGTWATLQAFGSLMVAENAPGWLLVTASEHAIGVPFLGSGAYTTSKHAVLGLADVLRGELPEHVGISVMLPGLVDTGIWRSGRHRPDDLGGPSADNEMARMLLAHGMPADAVARLALDGVQREQFLVATHAHVQRYADKRAADVAEAFTALAESGAPAVSYDVMELVAAATASSEA